MNKIHFSIKISNGVLTFLLCIVTFKGNASDAITYIPRRTRLGDCLMNYSICKWFSFKYHIPLYYKPFKYSDKMSLSIFELPHSKCDQQRYSQTIRVLSEEDIITQPHPPTLFTSRFRIKGGDMYAHTAENPDFAQQLKKMLTPITLPTLIEIPKGFISVALHVRKGGGRDKPLLSRTYSFADKKWPTKFPPDSYYIEQLKRLSELVGHSPLFVYLFTDDRNPGALAEKYKQAVNIPTILFEWRKQGNSPDKNVIEDFYQMAQFECLIRSSSSFARASQLIGDHKIIFNPGSNHWQGDTLIIDKVNLTLRKGTWFKYYSLAKDTLLSSIEQIGL